MKRERIGSFPFDMESRVPMQLGRQSISSSLVAISELVKNSYDADAEKVSVKFYSLGQPNSALVIEDTGDGMNLELLLEQWLRIGTDAKEKVGRSHGKQRILTGSKGLGRLGIDRLCHTLYLQTKQSGMDHHLEICVDWAKYEKSGKVLSELLNDVDKVSLGYSDDYGEVFPDLESKGTRIIMFELRDNWTKELLFDLKNELSLLVSPYAGINDFKIDMNTGIPDLDGDIAASKILKTADWAIEAELDTEDQVSITVKSDLHNEDFKEGPYAWGDWIKGHGQQPPCGPFKFTMNFFPRTSKGKALDQVKFSKKALSSFLEANQGIRIYRDDFRVLPYGQPSGKGDWLDLGLRRSKNPEGVTQRGWKVGPHQAVGAISISRNSNPNLSDQTNREGIVDEPGFHALRAAVLKIIVYFESKVHESAVQRAKQEQKKISDNAIGEADRASRNIQAEAARLDGAVETFISQHYDLQVKDPDVSHLVESARKVVSEVQSLTVARGQIEKLYIKETRELEREKDTLANLASLGILAVSFGHEAQENASLAAANADQLKTIMNAGLLNMYPDREKIFRRLAIIQDSTNFISTFASFALGNVQPDKRTRRKINLRRVVHYVFKSFHSSLKHKNIVVDVSNDLDENFEIWAFRIDWESILVNLLTNSIVAMDDTPAAERKIKVELRKSHGDIFLTFSDSGCGLEAGTETEIFKPTFSTRRDRKGNTIGTGMGLSIVKTFVEDHTGGTIDVHSPGSLGGVEFTIRVPEVKKRKSK